MYAFLSYQNNDRAVAARIRDALATMKIQSFMAHEDIHVSEEWRVALLAELHKTDIFVPIISANYYQSVWCVQDSGIAAFRGMTIIPLSIDNTVPQGFLNNIQSTRIDGANPSRTALFPGLEKHNVEDLIDLLIALIGDSTSWRNAEANFQLILPYLDRATKKQVVQLLTVSAENGEVCNAADCAQKYLPPLVKSHGRFMKRKTRAYLSDTLKRYVRP
jgi:hypothetical protein